MALIDDLEALLNTSAQGASDTGLSGQVIDAALQKELDRLTSPETLIDPDLEAAIFGSEELRIQRMSEQLSNSIRERANLAGFVDQPFLEGEGGPFDQLNKAILEETNRAANMAAVGAAQVGQARSAQTQQGGQFAINAAGQNRDRAFSQPFNLYESLRQSRTNALNRDLDRELATQSQTGTTSRLTQQHDFDERMIQLKREFDLADQPSAARRFFLDLSSSLGSVF